MYESKVSNREDQMLSTVQARFFELQVCNAVVGCQLYGAHACDSNSNLFLVGCHALLTAERKVP